MPQPYKHGSFDITDCKFLPLVYLLHVTCIYQSWCTISNFVHNYQVAFALRLRLIYLDRFAGEAQVLSKLLSCFQKQMDKIIWLGYFEVLTKKTLKMANRS